MRIRRMAAVFLAGVFATGISLGLPQAAHATVVPDPNWNEIFSPGLQARSNTLCLDVPGGSSQEALRLQLWRCHGSDSQGAPQRWQFIRWGTDPDGHPSQTVWVILDESLQTSRLEAASWIMATGAVVDLGHCLSAYDTSDANGTPLNLGDCSRNVDQVWALG